MANDESTPKKEDKAFQPPDNDTPTKNKKDKRSLMPEDTQRHSKDNNTDDDGDSYSPERNWRGQGEYPPSWTMFEKMSKEQADFKKGMPFHNCGTCQFYQSGYCKIVRGHIAQEMGCRYFQKKYEPMVLGAPLRIRIR